MRFGSRGARARWTRLGWVAALVGLLGHGAVTEAGADAAGAAAPPAPTIVVDGTDWMASSHDQRHAFLVGVGNMIVAEAAFAKRHSLGSPPAGDRITQAVAHMKLADIEARITRWYDANPDRLSMPVMGVVWKDLVGQRSAGGTAR